MFPKSSCVHCQKHCQFPSYFYRPLVCRQFRECLHITLHHIDIFCSQLDFTCTENWRVRITWL